MPKKPKTLAEELDDWVIWECLECEEEHTDPIGIETHCRKCGRVYIVYGERHAIYQNVKVDIEND